MFEKVSQNNAAYSDEYFRKQKQRLLGNKELIEGGAKNLPVASGQFMLFLTPEQIQEKRKEMGQKMRQDLRRADFIGVGEKSSVNLPKNWSPETELKEINKEVHGLPPKEQSARRRQLMDEFIGRWAFVKRGIVNTAAILSENIYKNPDISDAELQAAYIKASSEAGIQNIGGEKFRKACAIYTESHVIIEEHKKYYEEKFGDILKEEARREFFKDTFGFELKGDADLSFGPVSVLWILYDAEDYARAYGSEKEASSTGGGKIGAVGGGGYAGLEGLVTIINADTFKKEPEYIELVAVHEEQHVLNDIFERALTGEPLKNNQYFRPLLAFYLRQFRDKHITPESLFSTDSLPELEKALKHSAQNFIGTYFDSIKDEIVAYVKEGRNPKRVSEILHETAADGGVYDYLYMEDAHARTTFFAHIRILSICRGIPYEVVKNIELIALGALDREYKIYKKFIDRAVKSTEALKKLYPEKRGELTLLLNSEPIKKWPRMARLLGAEVDPHTN